MVYAIREKFWSWGGEFRITDQHDNPCYIVKGKAFSWGHQLSFQNLQGQELAFIKQKMWSFKPRYEIYTNGVKFAQIVKEWTWFKKKFTLDIPGPNDYTIQGSFWDHNFVFTRGGRTVATISKNIWGWTDRYGIDIIAGEDDISILCTCIVIDQVLDDERAAAT